MPRTKRGIVVLVAAVVLLLGAAAGYSRTSEMVIPDDPPGGGGPAYPAEKVESAVVEEINTSGSADYFIWMMSQADLGPAAALRTKAEKGLFVYNALTQMANSSQASLRASLDSQGVTYESLYIVNGILVRGGTLATLADAANRADVREITANHEFQADLPPTDTPPAAAGIESNILFVGADIVWNRGQTGQGSVLAANDTGLDEDHPAIKSHYRGCLNPPTCTSEDHHYDWWDATRTYLTDPFDGNSHGTHVTGTMVGDDGGANRIGVAPGAKTIHCKNLNNGGGGTDAWILECFQWDLAPWDLN
ncbi:MAG: S8 family serine peptidase, partial [Tepidiformaceae bacterium]